MDTRNGNDRLPRKRVSSKLGSTRKQRNENGEYKLPSHNSHHGEDTATGTTKRTRRKRKINHPNGIISFIYTILDFQSKPTISRSKQQQKSLGNIRTVRFNGFLALLVIVIYVLFKFNLLSLSSSSSSNELIIDDASVSFQNMYYERLALIDSYRPLYDTVHQQQYTVMKEENSPREDDIETHSIRQKKSENNDNNTDDDDDTYYQLNSMYGEGITKCNLTVVMMDPRIGFPKQDFGPGQPLWFALESVGAFAPESCVILQTTDCVMRDHLKKEDNDTDNKKDKVLEYDDDVNDDEHNSYDDVNIKKEISKTIYENSLPLFRKMIESGLVRLSIIDVEKYNLKSCHDFGNPTPAFINRKYWGDDEFIPNVDSNMVLIMQDDAALCHSIQVQLPYFQNYAYVAGVWPKISSKLSNDPLQGSCLGMKNYWKGWLSPQRRWKLQQQQQQEQESDMIKKQRTKKKKLIPKPKYFLSEDFPSVCMDGKGPIGNGGFSLRDRNWMIRAIETCPHGTYSGIDENENNNNNNIDEKEEDVKNDNGSDTDGPPPCKVLDNVNEDIYFGTILQGLGAPMPDAYIASLFATEMLWPEETIEMYGLSTTITTSASSSSNNTDTTSSTTASSSASTTAAVKTSNELRGTNNNKNKFINAVVSIPKVRIKQATRNNNNNVNNNNNHLETNNNHHLALLTIPIGIHKPWWYHSNTLLLSNGMSNACPYLKYLFVPSMSRYTQ